MRGEEAQAAYTEARRQHEREMAKLAEQHARSEAALAASERAERLELEALEYVEAASADDTAAAAPSAAASSRAIAPGALTVAPHKKAILVTGDTWKAYARLKALQGRWNPTLAGWIFPQARRADVLASLRADPTNTVSVEEQVRVPAEQGRRRLTEEHARKRAGLCHGTLESMHPSHACTMCILSRARRARCSRAPVHPLTCMARAWLL